MASKDNAVYSTPIDDIVVGIPYLKVNDLLSSVI